MKKQSAAALVLFLMIPLLITLGGMLAVLINPEIAAGHPNYVRNWHLLNQLKRVIFFGSVAVAAVLWLLVCLLVIRSKKRSYLWLPLAVLGPFGFAVLAMLNDRDSAEIDPYTMFLRKLKWPIRFGYEVCFFAIAWELAYQAMVLKRILMIRYESATTGVSTAQIINVQNASSGMWAFAEGNEVIFLVVLFYLLRPVVFRVLGRVAAIYASPRH